MFKSFLIDIFVPMYFDVRYVFQNYIYAYLSKVVYVAANSCANFSDHIGISNENIIWNG